jgi:heat shock protein HslJ
MSRGMGGTAISPLSLEGAWDVEELAVGGELVPPLEGTSLSLEFLEDRVAGSGGVNRFMGSVTSGPTFGPLATTMMAGPEDQMSQERIYLEHLAAVDSYEVDADELLLIADGLVVVTLKRAGTDTSAKTS